MYLFAYDFLNLVHLMVLFQACETACITSSDWEKRFNNTLKRYNLLKEEAKNLRKKYNDSEEEVKRLRAESSSSQELREECMSLRNELASAKLQISSLRLANSQFSISQSGVDDLKTEVQNLTCDLAHRSERCGLYKRELDIVRKNYYGHLEKYRNDLFEEFCVKYNIPRSAFPDLDKPTRKFVPSLGIEDSDLENGSTDGESETGSEEDGEDDEEMGGQGKE